ncbi:hypothetical protein EUTSA_v10025424mg [Eutrema salsugineum]|uniref:DUF4005 domain-containing protein n=1 Tax=Eutrema salsugineum TaxID=72664 RepID=V4MN70_EUTSA|nr:uncharacterized protein LOC18028520 [Eutrema salsugineum]ESQ54328.1 hypothetical protein EUTSA_v10025424mg [Eutrema salsugineum]
MGRATRWFKGLFGIKPSSCSGSGVISNRLDRSALPAAGVSLCDSYETIPPNISEKEAAWLRSFYAAGEEEIERRAHAIAIAAATAAAADAAVAAAKAAAAVVKLTGQGKSGPLSGGKSRENRAAMQIQCAFRGYLARKALRALKGVVKIQALVRGFLVRKQAAATLRSMEALVRAQATVKFQRALRRIGNAAPARKSTERFSGSLENRNSGEETAKIVEVDTGTRPGPYRIRGPVLSGSDFLDNPFRRTLSSPLSGRVPPRLTMPKSEWEDCSSKFPSAQSTPRFAGGSPSRSVCCSGGGVEADAEAEVDAHRFCLLSGDYHSSYMADATSFRAKLRSQSAPRQRPDINTACGGWRKSIGGNGGLPVQRPSCSGVREAVVGNIERRRVQW